MDSQVEARFQILEANLARVDAGLSGEIQSTNGLHEPVVAVALVSVPVLSGLLVIDGFQTVEGSRIYLAEQSNGTAGLWVTHAGAWTRPSDWATGQVIARGEVITVGEGATSFPRFGNRWVVTTGGVVDTDLVLAFPAVDKGSGALNLSLSDRWINDTGAIAFAIDTTVGAPAPVNLVTLSAGVGNNGRATGTVQFIGTAGHVVTFAIFNF